MYPNCLEIFHNMKIIISLGLEGRITRMTLELIISKSFTLGAKRKFLEEQNKAITLVSEDGKFADAWIRMNAGADLMAPSAPTHSSSFSEIKEADLLKEFAAGRVTEANSSGTLLDKVARK